MTRAWQWLDPWYPVADPDMCEALQHQLRIEVSERHVLFGRQASLIARRKDTDDALFALADGCVAEVHMTWRSSVEPDPRWPGTAVFASLDVWARESMLPLHREFSELR